MRALYLTTTLILMTAPALGVLSTKLIGPEKVLGVMLDAKTRDDASHKVIAGRNVSILKYNLSSDTFTIEVTELSWFKGDTPPEWLATAVGNGLSLKDLKRRPSSIVGGSFNLHKDLWLLAEREVKAREVARKKTKDMSPHSQ